LATPFQTPVVDVEVNILDTDGDGLDDVDEVVLGTDPFDGETDAADDDTDTNGLLDGDEASLHGTDPNDADSDDDGLTDGEEVNEWGTDPLDEDTDDGGVTDGEEVARGSNPLDAVDDFPTDPLPGAYLGGACRCDSTSGASGSWGFLALGRLGVRRRTRQDWGPLRSTLPARHQTWRRGAMRHRNIETRRHTD
jgi:hypothetical protein